MARTKVDRSKSTERADHDHAIRKEYRDAGHLDGLVYAWSCVKRLREHYATAYQVAAGEAEDLRGARDSMRIAELMLAREARRFAPKSAVAALTALGWEAAGTGDTVEVKT